MKRISFLQLAGLVIIFSVSCTGSNDTPVTVDLNFQPEVTAEAVVESKTGYEHLWGFWDIYVDFENQTVETSYNRTAMFALNVVRFLNNDPAGIQIYFNGVNSGAGYINIDLDVTISHPLDNANFDGYDVRGIFIGNGSDSLNYNPDLIYPVKGVDQILLNADGYTRWFNPAEFISPTIFGYEQGNLATAGYTGTATLNPYKYFGEGLGAVWSLTGYLFSGDPDVGYFLHGTSNTRNYELRFPVPIPGTKYGYAVVANWGGSAPEFHPSHAEEPVAIDLYDTSNLYYIDPTDNGGNLKLEISIYDWDSETTGGVMEDYRIFIDSTVLSTTYTLNTSQMTPVAGNHISSTYTIGNTSAI